METENTIRVFIADDHEIMRDGLKSLLRKQPDIDVVGQASTGQQAVKMARDLKPDVIVMDISMPVIDGIEASRQIVKENPYARIMVLSADLTKHVIDQAIEAGILGLMLKDSAFDEFVTAIRKVSNYEKYFCSRIINMLANSYIGRLQAGGNPEDIDLTEREYEVIRQVSNGRSSKEIALQIHMSGKTVDACRRNIMNKLNIDSTAELVKYALRTGITTL